MRTSRRILTVLCISALLVGWASVLSVGRTIFIPEDARTLAQAFARARSGDTIIIEERTTLRENIVVEGKDNIEVKTRRGGVTVKASKSDKPIIQLIDSANISFESIAFEGGSPSFLTDNRSSIVLLDCTVEGSDGSAIRGYGVKLDDCTIEASGGWGIDLLGDSSAMSGADLALTDVTITGNTLGGIRLAGGSASISAARIVSNTGYGMVVEGASTVTFSGTTTISENSVGGILVRNATFTLRGSAQVVNNLGVGIQAEDAVLNVEDTTVSGHPEAAIVYLRSSGRVSRTTVVDNSGIGILIDEGSDVDVSSTSIMRQGSDGVRVLGGSRATISGGSITDNARYGVYVLEEASATIQSGCVVASNALDGVRIESARGALSGSEVSGNQGNGVSTERSQGSIADSDVSGNTVNGVTVDGSAVTISASRVVENGANGVIGIGGSTVSILANSAVSDNAAEGVLLDGATGTIGASVVSSNALERGVRQDERVSVPPERRDDRGQRQERRTGRGELPRGVRRARPIEHPRRCPAERE